MSGDCDRCGEHALECRCRVDDLEALRLRITHLEERIDDLDGEVESLNARIDYLESS